MAARALTAIAAPKTYAELKRLVEETLLAGQRRIEQAKVRAYWETGRHIDAHLLLFEERADYGAQVIPRLGRDLDVSERVLYYCLKFARLYPILPTWAELTWGHYRVLTHVEDNAQRKALTLAAIKNSWNCNELAERVSNALALADGTANNGAADPNADTRPLTPKRGTPGLHPVVTRRGRLALDLGFKMYFPLSADDVRRLKLAEGSIVQCTSDPPTMLSADDATKADLFTYRALAVRVVDGDTLAVTVDLPPHDEADKKLRLRGINCPEMDTPEGKAAKRFVQNLVDRAKSVIITTSKPDKYDRYLADVFLVLESGEEIFLNNALLENGHAVRMDGSAPPELL